MGKQRSGRHQQPSQPAVEPHIRFLTAGLAAVESEASVRRRGMVQLLQDHSRQMLPGQLGVLREALGLSVKSMRTAQSHFCQSDDGRLAVADDLRRELEDPSVMVLIVRMPDRSGADA